MEKKDYTDSELIKLHNEGEIVILDSNNKTEDRYLINLNTQKHLYRNPIGNKYYLCEVTDVDDFDFGIVCDGIEDLQENETIQIKVFLPDCITELKVINEMSEHKLLDHLMYEALENLALVKAMTGESVLKLIEKYKEKAPDLKIKNL